MYEVFGHTADIGLRVRAESLEGLLAEAAAGLRSVLVARPEAVRPREARRVELAAEAPDLLLVDWLNELIYLYGGRHWIWAECRPRVDGGRLQARCLGEPVDPQRHEPETEVKAATYHGLKVEQDAPGRWTAEVILDA